MPPVAHYTEKRQGVANYLSTSKENKGLAKEEKIEMSPFYVEGDTPLSLF
jgi:hypothetical protein